MNQMQFNLTQHQDDYPCITISTTTGPIVTTTLSRSKAEAVVDQKLPKSAKSCAAIALHMHQPMIPAGAGTGLQNAKIISNLDAMLHQGNDQDRYNAQVYLECYQRIGDMVPNLIEKGFLPRIMLDYSGTLLYGLAQMKQDTVLKKLQHLTVDQNCVDAVEWLGTAWGHAVAPSTPVQDFQLHVTSWRHYFGHLFGAAALERVRGFSPPEMALPNHPDVAYEFVKTLVDSGYEWVIVQEHTVEEVENSEQLKDPNLPHMLVCNNSKGESASILAFIKTQGSDTKLVAQMQPWYEAQTLEARHMGGIKVPQVVVQISDGENGGVMMNEFPKKFVEVVEAAYHSDTPLVNLSAYLDNLRSRGIRDDSYTKIQPIWQGRIWERCNPGDGIERIEAAIETLGNEDHRFNVEGGSWTGNISWVKGYEGVINPMMRVSSLFNEHITAMKVSSTDPRYMRALYYLLLSQTSCYRYWGQGMWTDYGIELCRRAEEAICS
jgi:hypothetical protein